MANLINTLQGHTKSVHAAWFSPSGHHVLSLSADGSYRLWDTDSGKELFQWSRKNILDAVFHPARAELWLATADGTVCTFSLMYLGQREILQIENEKIQNLAIAPSGKFLLCTITSHRGHTGSLNIYHLDPVSLYHSIAGWFNGAAISPCETKVLIASAGPLELWQFEPEPKRLSFININQDAADSAWFSPKGNYAVGFNEVMLYEILHVDENTLLSLKLPEQNAQVWNGFDIHGSPRLVFSPDERFVVQTGYDKISVIELLTLREQATLSHPQGGPLYCVAISKDGLTLASGGEHGVCLWNLQTLKLLETFGSATHPVYGIQFHPRENKLIAFGCELQIWGF